METTEGTQEVPAVVKVVIARMNSQFSSFFDCFPRVLWWFHRFVCVFYGVFLGFSLVHFGAF